MELFFQKCADDHLCASQNRKLVDILLEYEFHIPFPNIFQQIINVSLSAFMSSNCGAICLEYLSYFDCFEHWFSRDDEVDSKVIDGLATINGSTHWIIKKARHIGVCNTLVLCGQESSFRCASDEFIDLFLGVGKCYGKSRFLDVLRFTGILPSGFLHLYSELLNRMSEMWKLTPTRCLLGLSFCKCYEAEPQMMIAYEALLDEKGYDKLDEIQLLLASQFCDVIPVIEQKNKRIKASTDVWIGE